MPSLPPLALPPAGTGPRALPGVGCPAQMAPCQEQDFDFLEACGYYEDRPERLSTAFLHGWPSQRWTPSLADLCGRLRFREVPGGSSKLPLVYTYVVYFFSFFNLKGTVLSNFRRMLLLVLHSWSLGLRGALSHLCQLTWSPSSF